MPDYSWYINKNIAYTLQTPPENLLPVGSTSLDKIYIAQPVYGWMALFMTMCQISFLMEC